MTYNCCGAIRKNMDRKININSTTICSARQLNISLFYLFWTFFQIQMIWLRTFRVVLNGQNRFVSIFINIFFGSNAMRKWKFRIYKKLCFNCNQTWSSLFVPSRIFKLIDWNIQNKYTFWININNKKTQKKSIVCPKHCSESHIFVQIWFFTLNRNKKES